jgi:hypothetical protein
MGHLAIFCLPLLLSRQEKRFCQQLTELRRSARAYVLAESKPMLRPRLLGKAPRVAAEAHHIWIRQSAGYWTAMQRGQMTRTDRLSRHILRCPAILSVCARERKGKVTGSYISKRERRELAVQSEVASHRSVLGDDQELFLIRPTYSANSSLLPL